MSLTIGSLFSGIGGLELGLEWAGLGPVLWQCEVDPFCRRVLAKHWPNVTRFDDVTSVRRYPHVDLVCGGFPCQDVSSAGKKRGIGGNKSGLWWHFASVLEQVRPRFVVVENVASGARRWMPHVRHQLHLLGYRTTALGMSAADVGAPHLRRRVFIVAAHTDSNRKHARAQHAEVGGASPPAANSDCAELWVEQGRSGRPDRRAEAIAEHASWRSPEPNMVRVVHGLSRGLDGRRRSALGNAVVPQCAEVVGRYVMQLAGVAS